MLGLLKAAFLCFLFEVHTAMYEGKSKPSYHNLKRFSVIKNGNFTDCNSVLTEQLVPFSAFDFDNQPGSSSMFRSHVMRDDEFYCADSQAGGFN